MQKGARAQVRGTFPFFGLKRLALAMAVKGGATQVVGLGQCSLDFLGEIDCYPAVDQKAELLSSTVQGGGPVATALVTLQRLGVDTAIVGRVGDDEFGDRIRQGLHDEGVDCRHLQAIAGKVSQHAFITVERGSGRCNIFWYRGSCPPLAPEGAEGSLIRSARVLHLDGLQLEASIVAAGIARSEGVVTVLDGGTLRPGVERLLPFVDHAVVSERFAQALADGNGMEQALEQLLQFGAQAATVTLGDRGSVTLTRDGSRLVQKSFAVEAVDTTGCGDVFHGGYIYGLLQGWILARTLEFAAACAALKTRAVGGRTAIACLSEVEEFIAARSRSRGRLSGSEN